MLAQKIPIPCAVNFPKYSWHSGTEVFKYIKYQHRNEGKCFKIDKTVSNFVVSKKFESYLKLGFYFRASTPYHFSLLHNLTVFK